MHTKQVPREFKLVPVARSLTHSNASRQVHQERGIAGNLRYPNSRFHRL